MIKIENVQVFGFDPAIHGMRNPLNSWKSSDSEENIFYDDTGKKFILNYDLGKKDFKLARTLAEAGNDHGKYTRFIWVYMDISAPLYWWKEFDTYKIGTVADPYNGYLRDPNMVTNSCSTMHKMASEPITMDDFSTEHLMDANDVARMGQLGSKVPSFYFKELVKCIEECRVAFLETKDKAYWWQMIQMLPSSYNQTRTVMINYQALQNIRKARRNHKLDEWNIFVDFIEQQLPYFQIIYGQDISGDKETSDV